MTFLEAFCLWLASFGLTEDEQSKVCANRRLAACLEDRDAADTMREVGSALYCLHSPESLAARKAANDTREQLGLMLYLQDYVDDQGPADSIYTALKNRPLPPKEPAPAKPATPAVRKEPVPVDGKALLERICRTMELTREEYKTLSQALS